VIRRIVAGMVVVAGLVAGCGDAGPEAPAPAPTETLCRPAFCVGYPGDWEVVEETDEFVSLRHPAAPEEVVATVGLVNMEGLVTAAGGEWPQQPDAVVRSFWDLIDDGNAEMSTMTPLPDGSVESFGTFGGGRMWYRLVPVEFSDAIGVEMRAPNSSWSTHAEVLLDGLEPVDP
jgi:hypothetical protein